jgi:hypothetical protein
MKEAFPTFLDLSREQKGRLMTDMVFRLIMHYGFWFSEVRHQMGMETALAMMDKVVPKTTAIAMDRMSEILGFELKNGLPGAVTDMDEHTLDELLRGLAKNWLVMDGVWFQAVESVHGMNDAKRCNDSCWGKFSPYEAHAIKKLLNLKASPGLEGLKKALNFRMYSFINKQSMVDEGRKVLYSRWMSAGFRLPDSARACRIILANQPGWWNTPILQGPLIQRFKQPVLDAPRIHIRMTGSVPGGLP